MVKKIVKVVLKGILGIVILCVLFYAGFHFWEYFTGAKYIEYLNANSETRSLKESFSFRQLEKDITENSLILVGETHGFNEPQKFDYDLFTYLNSHHHVTHYYAELDFVQAIYLNMYMETGDESFLRDALQNWAVVQGRNNKDYYDKYRKFRNYHTGLDDKDKFIFVGIDKIQDMELTARFLHRLEINSTDTLSGSIEMEDVLHKLASLEEVYKESPDTAFLLSHLKANLDYVETKKNREHVMFENFHGLYTKWNHVDKRAYGYFGLYHVFQYSINGRQPFAAQVRASDLGLENSIISINFLMVDSYMVMPSAQIPEFMRDSGAYSRMPISSDVMLFMYIYGIKDFKRMTPENHKSFIKMNAENSPYGATSRMNKTIQLLPVVDKMEFSEPGKPYIQYTVFVRNSDWAEPEMN